MRQIIIEQKNFGDDKVEMVERKGIGHPDTICDSVCDAASLALSSHYLKHFGRVLHHNVDKGLLVAGKSIPKFGGGRVVKPFSVTIAGRATASMGMKKIPVKNICEDSAKKFLKQFRYLKPSYFRINAAVEEGAGNLKEVFKKGARDIGVANDTSYGCAHWPLSETEDLVLGTADYINSEDFKRKYKAAGEDIKVMGMRTDGKQKLTVAIAFVDRYVSGMKDYIELKAKIVDELKRDIGDDISVELNTLDDTKGDESSIYLTVTGLSAEMGDDGQVGRGNRPNGLITPNWPMSLEATAGKNINHPGKLYQVMAQVCAEEVCKVGGVDRACVKLLSQIGKPLDQPQAASVQIAGKGYDSVKVRKAVDSVFERVPEIQKGIVKGKYRMF